MAKRRKCANCIWGEQCSNVSELNKDINISRKCDKCDTEDRVCDYFEGYNGDIANLVHYIKELKKNTKSYNDGVLEDENS